MRHAKLTWLVVSCNHPPLEWFYIYLTHYAMLVFAMHGLKYLFLQNMFFGYSHFCLSIHPICKNPLNH